MKKQYKEPEEMIDHNGNLDTVSGLMSIFFAYNQKEADEGTTLVQLARLGTLSYFDEG